MLHNCDISMLLKPMTFLNCFDILIRSTAQKNYSDLYYLFTTNDLIKKAIQELAPEVGREMTQRMRNFQRATSKCSCCTIL